MPSKSSSPARIELGVVPELAKRIELWPIDRLIPFARNPRTHSEAQVAQIAASIVEFGFLNPILVDTKAGILAGHGRLLAARKLQLKKVPVIVLDHLTETQKRAYIIADNQLALNAGWDDDLLRVELPGRPRRRRTAAGHVGGEDHRARPHARAVPTGTDQGSVPE